MTNKKYEWCKGLDNLNNGQEISNVFRESTKQLEVPKRQFTLDRVQSLEVLEKEWEPLLCKVFTDAGDREPIELLKERLENGENFFILRDEQGAPMGIELSQVLLKDESETRGKAMYVPWTGLTEEYRNLGIGPHMHNAISSYMKEKYGVTHSIIDIEDPNRLHDSGYAPEEMDDAIGFAKRRINYWRREGYMVVDDASKITGDKLEYCRPGSEDEQSIQAYDHLTVRVDNEELRNKVLNSDQTQISKAFVRECYVDMNRIQYDDFSEDDMRREYPAIDGYLNNIDNHPGEWLAIRTEAIDPKISPVASHSITLEPSQSRNEFPQLDGWSYNHG